MVPSSDSEHEGSPPVNATNDRAERRADTARLDHKELNVDFDSDEALDQEWRHWNWSKERKYWLSTLPLIETSQTRILKFQHCGEQAWLQTNQETGEVRLTCQTCKMRICSACNQRIRRSVRERIQALLQADPAQKWRCVTLTRKSTQEPLKTQLKKLLQAFRRLRQSKLWKHCSRGGVALAEVTRNRETGLWHPHLHILVNGTYLPKPTLIENWKKASRGSYIVDVMLVKHQSAMATYLTKYMTKPEDHAGLTDVDQARDYYESLQQGHRLVTFGNCRGKRPLPTRPIAFDKWQNRVQLAAVRRDAFRGETHACRLLAKLIDHNLTYLDVTEYLALTHAPRPPPQLIIDRTLKK